MPEALPPRGPEQRARRVSVAEARRILTDQEADRLIDFDSVLSEAIRRVEQQGIVFLDEVDKIVGSGDDFGPGVSDEGVQRDLLPIVEGATVARAMGRSRPTTFSFSARARSRRSSQAT